MFAGIAATALGSAFGMQSANGDESAAQTAPATRPTRAAEPDIKEHGYTIRDERHRRIKVVILAAKFGSGNSTALVVHGVNPDTLAMARTAARRANEKGAARGELLVRYILRAAGDEDTGYDSVSVYVDGAQYSHMKNPRPGDSLTLENDVIAAYEADVRPKKAAAASQPAPKKTDQP